ncbi:hypothetical protein BGW42_002909 [Actinomortierella wolfii]|nr:hypothetical protein BGW42_002909 [Actinomortierella wolfii]
MQQKRQEIKRELMLNDPKSPYLRELRREDGEAVDSSFDGAGSDNDGRGGGMSQDDGHRHRKKEKEKTINMDGTSGRRSTSPLTQQGPISRTTPSPTALRPNGYISKKQSNHESKGASTIPSPVLAVVQSSTAVAGSGRRSPNPDPSYEHMTTHGSPYTDESNPLSAASATGTAVAAKKEAKKTEASFSEQRVPEQIRALEKDADRHIQAAKERNRRLEQIKEWIMQYKEQGTSATEEMEEAEEDDAEEETEGEKEAAGRSLQVMDSEDSTADKEKIEQLEKALAEMETKLQRASARQVETERQLRQAEAKCSVYSTKMDKLARTADERQMMLEHLILENKGADDSQFQSWYERYSLLLERHNLQSPKKDKWKEARLRRAKRWSQKRRERQERIDAMSAQVAQQQNQLTAVQAQLSESKAKVESLNQLKATNSDLETKNLELATLLEEHQRHGLNHRKQLQDKDTEIDQLKHDIEVFKQQEQMNLLRLEQQQQDFQAREEDLSEELKTAMSQLKRERQPTASLKQKLHQKEQEGQQSKSASEQQYLSSKMKELDALSHQVVELGTTLEQMSHWLTVLRDEFRGEDEDRDDDGINGPASASAHGHDGDHHEPQSPSSLNTVDGQFEYLRSRIRSLKQDRDAQAQQLIDNENKEADLKQQMAELEQELKIVVDHIAEIRQENQKKFENQQRQHEQRSRELEAEIEEQKDESDNLKKEIARKNDALAVLQSQLDDAQGKLQLQNERTAHLEADLAKTNTQLSKDLEATKAALATSESTVRKLEHLIEEAEQQNQGRCRHCRSSATEDDSEYVSYGGSPNQSSMLSVSSCAMCRHSIRGHSEDEQENEARRQHETILREQVDQLENQITLLETELTRSEKKRCELQEELEELSGMVEDQAEGARSMYAKKLERIKRLENENKELRQLVIKQETNLYLYHSRVITLKFERGKLLEELHKRDRQDRQDALLDAEKEGRGKLLQGKEKSLGERKERRTLAPPNEIEG